MISPMKYKALILDLDGTTVRNNEHAMPSKKVAKAIEAADKLIHVSVATSRRFIGAIHIVEKLQLTGPSIFQAGALIVDLPSHKIISQHILHEHDYNFITKTLTEMNLDFFVENLETRESYVPGLVLPNTFTVVMLSLSEDIAKEIQTRLETNPRISIHTGPSWTKEKVWLSINSAKATKQHAVLEVAKILGIQTEEIIGVGDAPNDFPLLMACGLKVAMGNADDSLKAIADYIAPTVDEDGVAEVIEKFILSDRT